MNRKELLRTSVRGTVGLMTAMTAEMSSEQLHWNPPGTAHSVAASYAHAALSTDWQIQELFEGGTPHFETDWAGKTGVNNPMAWQTLEWAQSVRIEDMLAFQKYARAIFNEVDAYIDNLSDEDLARPIDMSLIGAGDQPLVWCLTMVVAGHLNQLLGEMAAVKGMQGLKGYPG